MKPFTSKDLESKIQFVLRKTDAEHKIDRKLEEAKVASDEERLEDAREACKDVLKMDPKNISAFLCLADTYLRQGDVESFDEAIGYIKKAIQANPESDLAYIALALAFEEAKSLDKAIQLLQDATVKIPSSEDILYHLGRLNLRRGHTDAGVVCLKKALKINPDFEEATKLLENAGVKK
jgi:tetratricopeptide (TPR) repeat protein